jgi:TolA-binding protein
MQKTYIALVLATLLLFSGCIGGGGEAGDYLDEEGWDSEGDYSYTTSAMMAPGEAALDMGGHLASSSKSQMLIREGSITLDVPEGTLEEKKEELGALISQYRGEITYMSFYEYSYAKTYSFTVKISPSDFDSFTSELSELGEITSMDTVLEDVTDEYTDLQTRISNLQEELARLNALYEQAEDVEEILLIEREVTRVQTELEIYQYRAEDLESRSAKSTMTIYLSEPKPAVETDLMMPLGEILNMFLGALSFGIIVVVGLAGFLIPIGIAAYAIRAAYNLLKKKGGSQKKGK